MLKQYRIFFVLESVPKRLRCFSISSKLFSQGNSHRIRSKLFHKMKNFYSLVWKKSHKTQSKHDSGIDFSPRTSRFVRFIFLWIFPNNKHIKWAFNAKRGEKKSDGNVRIRPWRHVSKRVRRTVAKALYTALACRPDQLSSSHPSPSSFFISIYRSFESSLSLSSTRFTAGRDKTRLFYLHIFICRLAFFRTV